jgi:hypothetical protein
MTREIKVETCAVILSEEGDNIRVKSDKNDVLFLNQDIDTLYNLIKHNFNIVNSHYKLMIDATTVLFHAEDINEVSISIVLYYLYMYNSWRSMYKKQENKDLRFYEKDFTHPSTHDIIFTYLKSKYPKNWEEKSSVLIGVGLDDLRIYYKRRQDFYNK